MITSFKQSKESDTLNAKTGRGKSSDFARNFKQNWGYLIFLLPAVIVTFVFAYVPIYGLLISFQDYMPGDSILSDTTVWVGFDNFVKFFND